MTAENDIEPSKSTRIINELNREADQVKRAWAGDWVGVLIAMVAGAMLGAGLVLWLK